MADYGLAAQIGRGGGGGGGAVAQVDPLNRMTQLMKLQNLQQNMMLAQEAAARQRELHPGLVLAQETERKTAQARIGLIGEQTRAARAAAEEAEMSRKAARGVLDYTANTPPELRTDPKRLDALRIDNPGAYTAVLQQIARTNEIQAKARAEGYSAERARLELTKTASEGVLRVLPSVANQQDWDNVFNNYAPLNPLGASMLPREYSPDAVKKLRTQLQDIKELEYQTDPLGYEFILNKRTGDKIRVNTVGAPDAVGAPPQTSGAANELAGPSVNAMGAPPIKTTVPPESTPSMQGESPAATKKRVETEAGKRAEQTVKASEEAGQIDYALGEIDRITKLIGESTGSGLGARVDAIARFFGIPLSGAVAIAKLKPQADILLKRVPRFEGPQSKEDVASYEAAAGRAADPTITRAERIAAVQEIERLLIKRRDQIAASGAAKPRVPKPETGVQRVDDRTVIAPDGTTHVFKTSEQADRFEQEAAKMHRQKGGR